MDEIMECHIFTAHKFSGTIKESDEMLPQWFNADINSLPIDKMWKDDQYWLPLLINNKIFDGYFLFANDEETIIKKELNY
jgi:hypothetical protein